MRFMIPRNTVVATYYRGNVKYGVIATGNGKTFEAIIG